MRPELFTDWFDTRVCVLTGASGGIGRALARDLSHQGARLILSGRRQSELDALRATLPEGGVVAVVAGDLREVAVQRALAAAAASHGASVLINLLGANLLGLLAEQSETQIGDLVSTNLLVPMLLTHQLLPQLLSVESAAVVNVGSVLGAIGHPGYAAYCASKFGLRGFSEALRRELMDTAVKVFYLAPRTTRTSMNSTAAMQMNAALGNTADEPEVVARWIVESIAAGRLRGIRGLPERFFTAVNALLPGVVDRALAGKLGTVKRYAGASGAITGGIDA